MTEDERADKSNEAPDSVKAFESVAKGYKYYLNYLKSGGSSAISSVFGKAADILPEEMRIRPAPSSTSSQVEGRLPTKEAVAISKEKQSSEVAARKPNEPSNKEVGITEQQYVELGALKTAFDVLKLDWAKLKNKSVDPIELIEQFDQSVNELDTKYHQQGYLKDEHKLVGFLNSGRGPQILVSQVGSEIVWGIDPETGELATRYKMRLQFPGIRLDVLT